MNGRQRLASMRTAMGSDVAFLSNDSVDLDQSMNYQVIKKRVFFDDVQLVTLHRERGLWFLLTTGAWGLLWIAIAIFIVAIEFDTWPVALGFFAVGAPAALAFLIRLAIGRDVVTVAGRRSRVALKFGMFRKQRAREVYGQICAAVRRTQSRATRAATPPAEFAAPPLPPDVPLPPPAQ